MTTSQMMTVLFLVLIPMGTEGMLPSLTAAGPAMWLCPLAAGAAALLLVAWVGRKGLGDPLACFGKGGSRGWALLFLLWGLVLTAAQAARVADRLSISLGTSPALLSLGALALSAFLADRGPGAFARAAQIFAMAIGGAFALLCLFGVFRLEWANVLLWEPGQLAWVPRGAVDLLGVLAAGCYVLFILKEGEAGPEDRPLVLTRLGRIFLLLAGALVLVAGRLGPDLVGELPRPFFKMVSGLGFEGAFQRLEELVSALWFLGDAALLALLLLAMGRLTEQLRPGKPARRVWILAAVTFLLSIPTPLWEEVLAVSATGWITLLVGGLILLFSGLSRKREEKMKKLEKRG